MSLYIMQQQHKDWIAHNFPHQTFWHALAGMTEEMGELAHAILKRDQKIRGGIMPEEEVIAKIKDAHADLIIFSFFLANYFGYDLMEVVAETWERVRERDWVANPEGKGYE